MDHQVGDTSQDDNISRSTSSIGAISSSDKILMVDLTRDKPIKISVRVIVPVRNHPKFNFVGKLLGPRGNSLKRLQEDTMCKMSVLGRGSMKDRIKENDLLASGNPKFSHLAEDLHVVISTNAPPAEAYARIAYALVEVRRFLVPDYHDDIRQEQMWEMQQSMDHGTNENPSTKTLINPSNNNNNNNNHQILNIVNGNIPTIGIIPSSPSSQPQLPPLSLPTLHRTPHHTTQLNDCNTGAAIRSAIVDGGGVGICGNGNVNSCNNVHQLLQLLKDQRTSTTENINYENNHHHHHHLQHQIYVQRPPSSTLIGVPSSSISIIPTFKVKKFKKNVNIFRKQPILGMAQTSMVTTKEAVMNLLTSSTGTEIQNGLQQQHELSPLP